MDFKDLEQIIKNRKTEHIQKDSEIMSKIREIKHLQSVKIHYIIKAKYENEKLCAFVKRNLQLKKILKITLAIITTQLEVSLSV